MRETADIVIIGAGALGCSAAYHLSNMGARNVVVPGTWRHLFR